MLRVCPEDQRCQNRVHKTPPYGYSWDIVLRPVILANENDIADDVEQTEQHIESDKGYYYCGRFSGRFQVDIGKLLRYLVDGRYLDICQMDGLGSAIRLLVFSIGRRIGKLTHSPTTDSSRSKAQW